MSLEGKTERNSAKEPLMHKRRFSLLDPNTREENCFQNRRSNSKREWGRSHREVREGSGAKKAIPRPKCIPKLSRNRMRRKTIDPTSLPLDSILPGHKKRRVSDQDNFICPSLLDEEDCPESTTTSSLRSDKPEFNSRKLENKQEALLSSVHTQNSTSMVIDLDCDGRNETHASHSDLKVTQSKGGEGENLFEKGIGEDYVKGDFEAEVSKPIVNEKAEEISSKTNTINTRESVSMDEFATQSLKAVSLPEHPGSNKTNHKGGEMQDAIIAMGHPSEIPESMANMANVSRIPEVAGRNHVSHSGINPSSGHTIRSAENLEQAHFFPAVHSNGGPSCPSPRKLDIGGNARVLDQERISTSYVESIPDMESEHSYTKPHLSAEDTKLVGLNGNDACHFEELQGPWRSKLNGVSTDPTVVRNKVLWRPDEWKSSTLSRDSEGNIRLDGWVLDRKLSNNLKKVWRWENPNENKVLVVWKRKTSSTTLRRSKRDRRKSSFTKSLSSPDRLQIGDLVEEVSEGLQGTVVWVFDSDPEPSYVVKWESSESGNEDLSRLHLNPPFETSEWCSRSQLRRLPAKIHKEKQSDYSGSRISRSLKTGSDMSECEQNISTQRKSNSVSFEPKVKVHFFKPNSPPAQWHAGNLPVVYPKLLVNTGVDSPGAVDPLKYLPLQHVLRQLRSRGIHVVNRRCARSLHNLPDSPNFGIEWRRALARVLANEANEIVEDIFPGLRRPRQNYRSCQEGEDLRRSLCRMYFAIAVNNNSCSRIESSLSSKKREGGRVRQIVDLIKANLETGLIQWHLREAQSDTEASHSQQDGMAENHTYFDEYFVHGKTLISEDDIRGMSVRQMQAARNYLGLHPYLSLEVNTYLDSTSSAIKLVQSENSEFLGKAEARIKQMNIPEMKSWLTERGLETSGAKSRRASYSELIVGFMATEIEEEEKSEEKLFDVMVDFIKAANTKREDDLRKLLEDLYKDLNEEYGTVEPYRKEDDIELGKLFEMCFNSIYTIAMRRA